MSQWFLSPPDHHNWIKAVRSFYTFYIWDKKCRIYIIKEFFLHIQREKKLCVLKIERKKWICVNIIASIIKNKIQAKEDK